MKPSLVFACLTALTAWLAAPAQSHAMLEDSVTAQQESLMMRRYGSPGPVYGLAKRFTRKGEFEKSRALLLALRRHNHPLVLNQLGYVTRQTGKPAEAITYYEKALEIDPGFLQARQYLGEAWLQLNKPELAKMQLANLDALCGKDCLAYRELEQAIIAHATGSPAPAKSW